MLTFIKLSIQGFKSFGANQTLTFPKSNGLNYIKGENRVEPKLEANGSGKTSIISALTWVLYGVTERGVKAGNVVNRDEEHKCQVGVLFNIDKDSYELIRVQGKNSLTLSKNGDEFKPVTQAIIDELLGMDYDTFLRIVVMGQTNRFFFDLEPTEKLAVFSNALDLDYWIECSDRAKNELKATEAALSALVAKITRLEGQKDANKVQLENSIKQAASYEIERISDLAAIQHDIDVLVVEIKEQTEDLAIITQNLDKRLKRVDEDVKGFYTLQNERRTPLAKKYALESDKTTLERSLKDKNKELSNLEASGSKCFSCGQSLKGDAKDKYTKKLEDLKDSIRELTFDLDGKKVEIVKAEKDLLASEDAYKAEEANLSKVRKDIDGVKLEKNTLETTSKASSKELAQLKVRYDALVAAKNPHQESIDKTRLLIEANEVDKTKLEKTRSVIQKEYEGYQYWVSGFKEIRLWLIEEALEEFELEVASSLGPLGLDNWKVTFDIEKENKSGTISKEFSVFITPPNSEEPVPWKAWSGGETQRLRIAGNDGLSSLICARKGIECNLQMWDEPTMGLSQSGIDDMLDYFSDRSKNKQIWVIDHKSLHSGNFDNVYMVVKEQEGSLIYKE
jgi:DNA repair exonuclease SbcCD ATPase subunit